MRSCRLPNLKHFYRRLCAVDPSHYLMHETLRLLAKRGASLNLGVAALWLSRWLSLSCTAHHPCIHRPHLQKSTSDCDGHLRHSCCTAACPLGMLQYSSCQWRCRKTCLALIELLAVRTQRTPHSVLGDPRPCIQDEQKLNEHRGAVLVTCFGERHCRYYYCRAERLPSRSTQYL